MFIKITKTRKEISQMYPNTEAALQDGWKFNIKTQLFELSKQLA